MNKAHKYFCFPVLLAMAIAVSFNATAFAQDDGARAYWNARAGTRVVSFQYLPIGISASGSKAFAPGQFIYPNSDIEASIFIGTFAYHTILLKRPSAFAVNVLGGNVGVGVNTSTSPDSLPPITPGAAFSQSSSGFSDPNMQLVVNLFGTPPLKSTVDLLNYEPTSTLDVAMMLALPIGEYDNDKLVNMGLNRWYGRIALPFKYHFGTFSRGYMSSLELIPSVWFFADNDDFLGQNLQNDPLLQFEAHLTHDFTQNFFGSIDLLYRGGFQSEINGTAVGEKLDIGDLGFTLNSQVTDNVTIRGSYSSNVFGDADLDSSMIRLQFVYAWHRLTENMKKLKTGH